MRNPSLINRHSPATHPHHTTSRKVSKGPEITNNSIPSKSTGWGHHEQPARHTVSQKNCGGGQHSDKQPPASRQGLSSPQYQLSQSTEGNRFLLRASPRPQGQLGQEAKRMRVQQPKLGSVAVLSPNWQTSTHSQNSHHHHSSLLGGPKPL